MNCAMIQIVERLIVAAFLFQGQSGVHLSGPDWLSDAVRPVLVTQAVIGTIALIGLVAVLRRFLQHEFPAAMANVNDRLDTLHQDFKSLETEFRRSLLEVERLKERVDNQSRRLDGLDVVIGQRRTPRNMS